MKFNPGRLLLWIAGAAALAAAAAFSLALSPPGMAPAVHDGVFDLSRWNFATAGKVRLSGQWLYYPDRWASQLGAVRQGIAARVPGAWPMVNGVGRARGFGTYRLRLVLPEASDGEPLAIDTGQVYSAYRLYANGRLIAEGGRPAALQTDERANSYSALALLPALPRGQRTVDLRLEISNHLNSYGGVFSAGAIGSAAALAAERRLTEMIALVVVGILLMAALFHLLFAPLTRGSAAHVWFGALAALLAFRNFLFEPLASHLVPLMGQDLVWRFDYAVTALALVPAYWFFACSFPGRLSRRYGFALGAFCAGAATLTLASGPAAGEDVLKVVEAVAGVTVVYLVYTIVRAARAGEKGAGLALSGWLIVSAAILHDVLLDNHVISGPNVLPYGCVAFFLCVSGMLTARSQAAYLKVRTLSAELAHVNEELEDAVAARTAELRQKIVELENHQRALEQSRAAALEASATKSRFLANMSHELRTPLNAILGFSQILESQLFGTLIPRYVSYAADIRTSGDHLLALIDDILDLSKIEAGRYELQEEPLLVARQVGAVLRLIDAQARARDVRIETHIVETLAIMADERALRQILVNLLVNAVKFTPPGGSVRVLAAPTLDGTVEIRIEDTGIGIKPEDMARVFESFGQGRHDIAPSDERGTGLGLPIVKGLVEAHGGEFSLESSPGTGTSACVSFPPERSVIAPRAA